ncbi:ATP-binding protein [Thauera linaloolentis]|uniref:histidine kinase n=1 Tax=Thauera linaloolentis (strain DSM 12138 / JCM 21573 / CCUG 41526 / CIP 105981 / IAM 15112 / NBRC 102519 / 47Lol) TaxID=1123367 RepID=N6Z8N0_THAL4|nr:ATP-binding protein [Thauera linaloolentis]ENO88509.1 PAS/PAC sensor hybrid histidine kinase [Thauera linaloolentis 47Lol = DSM 12138]MCM8567472.1 PAS domain S-box protein [Thauera linaloolentis]
MTNGSASETMRLIGLGLPPSMRMALHDLLAGKRFQLVEAFPADGVGAEDIVVADGAWLARHADTARGGLAAGLAGAAALIVIDHGGDSPLPSVRRILHAPAEAVDVARLAGGIHDDRLGRPLPAIVVGSPAETEAACAKELEAARCTAHFLGAGALADASAIPETALLVVDLAVAADAQGLIAAARKAVARWRLPLVFLAPPTAWPPPDGAEDDEFWLAVPIAAGQLAAIARPIVRAARDRAWRTHLRCRQLDTQLKEFSVMRRAIDQHAIVSMADADGRIIYANDKFCELSGFSLQELLGANHSIVKSGRHSDEFYAALWRTITRGRTWQGEVCNRKKNGEPYWVSTTIVPIVDDSGKPVRYVSIRTDITLLKATELRLQESRERHKFFADNVDEGVVVCDRGMIVDVSDRWLELFRCRRDDALGQPVMSFTAPSAVPMALQLIGEKWAESYESVMLRHDGTTFPAIVRGRDLEFGGRELRLTTILDISRQKETELAVKAARTEAERANQAKSEFLSSMSHELRTPMNAIFGFAQILEFDERLNEDQQDSVQEILKAARHLLGLINEVLDLAKIDSGRITLSIETVLVDAVADECEQLLRPLAADRKISLHLPSGPQGAVRADRVRLKQVLLNLLSNAIKYNHPQGEVRLTVDTAGPRLRITVADTGPGIAADKLGSLFQPFNRLDAEHGPVEGTGLGLAISRRMVEAMGGRIGVDSEPGRGCRFWIELPQADATPAAAPPARRSQPAESGSGGRQRHILYIDDNPVNLKLVTQILSRLRDIHLVTAHTPELGIELALTVKPDLILLDINLPGMDGYGVLQVFKADLQLRHIPVLALSANAMPKDIERGIGAGFTDYLTKPLDIGRFLASIDLYLPKRENG